MTHLKNKAVILGGGFNPIGLHHEEMAARIWDKVHAPVWLMPCYDHKFSKRSKLIPHAHRWNMVVEAISAPVFRAELVACDWEIANEHNGSMFEAMDGLTEKYPDTTFSIAIGMDNARVINLPREQGGWDRGELLIERFQFIVLKRTQLSFTPTSHHDDVPEWCQKPQHTVIEFDNPMSSSIIRSRIVDGASDGEYTEAIKTLNPRVWDYIQAGELYGYGRQE